VSPDNGETSRLAVWETTPAPRCAICHGAFLGQFVDHDVTFDLTSQLGVPTPPEATRNFREPALNLDSVYGGGYGDARFVLPDGTMRIET